jgi:hypothetical protein
LRLRTCDEDVTLGNEGKAALHMAQLDTGVYMMMKQRQSSAQGTRS